MPCHGTASVTMEKARELSVNLRTKIIDFHKVGTSYDDISKHLDIPRSTVQYVIKKFSKFGTVETVPGRDRKPKTFSKNYAKTVP